MKLFVVRHGQTVGNSKNIVCGVIESDLTENGHEQAAKLASRLLKNQEQNHISCIYVSPLRRARDTSLYVEKALGITAVVEKRLIEFNFGTSEGVSSDDPAFIKKRNNPYARFEGGESMFSAAQRLYNLVDEIKAKHGPRCENVLFVCHGTVGRIIDTYFNNVTIEYFTTYKMENCELKSYEL